MNAPSANATVRLATSLASACAAAVPVSVSVNTVRALLSAWAAVRPAGRLVTVTLPPVATPAVNVSPTSVAVTLPPTAPLLAAVSAKLPAQVIVEGSVKSMAMSVLLDPETVAAVSFVNAPSAKVMVTSLASSAFACAVALPVRVSVTSVSLVRVSTAVSPAGTLLALTWSPDTTSAVKVSPVSLAVTLPVTEPSFDAASVKLPA